MTVHIPFDNSYARLPQGFYARVLPTPVASPNMIAFNSALSDELGLPTDELGGVEGAEIFAGNVTAAGSDPIAAIYAGHQFGGWSPRLGDGRAHLLGEVLSPSGARFDIQLKGSGPTPYSRNGDGRAWLGPVLREYLLSEAMHALGVPTTRALAAVSTGQNVQRETALPGAVLARVATSHIRVGTFQYFAAKRDTDALGNLLDHVIERHDPAAANDADPAMAFFRGVIERQAHLVAHWMSIGFIHGVMNTDNTSISGETIDYGPCAFMDDYRSDAVFSSIDRLGRYAYRNQPDILVWNLAQLGGALLPLMKGAQDDAAENATQELRQFSDIYLEKWSNLFCAKLGLTGVRDGDMELAREFLSMMETQGADFTNTFRGLSDGSVRDALGASPDFKDWVAKWESRRAMGGDDALLLWSNPAVIPRNHRIEAMIADAVAGDFSEFETLRTIFSAPFDLANEHAEYALPPKADEVVTATFCGT